MNDQQYLLANAYVDGELTDDERRIAEADPDVMSEVEELRALRDQLGAVEPPSAAARDAAVAAAMGEFAHLHAPAGRVAPVVPHRPRPAYARFLAVAAAAVAVGLFGVVVVNSGLGGDDDDAGDDVASEQLDTSLTAADADRIEAADADDGGAELTQSTAEATAEDAEMSDEAVEMSEEAQAAEAAPAAEDAEEGGVAADDGAGELVRVDIEPGAPVADAAELGSLGTLLLELERSGELGTTPNTKCEPEWNILGVTELITPESSTPVYVGVQIDETRVLAIDQESCVVLLVGPLFEPTP